MYDTSIARRSHKTDNRRPPRKTTVNKIIVPAIAFAITAAAQIPAYAASTVTQAPKTTETVATLAQTFTLKDANGNTVGTLVADNGRTYRIRLIGTTIARPKPVETNVFRVDYSKALSPGQMDAACNAARDRFFNVDHTLYAQAESFLSCG